MTTKKECLIYMRTSTLTNVKGDSVKRQKSSIMKWVKSYGYCVRGEYWDVESGSKDTLDRPEFMRMISDSERMGIRVLVFSDQSRLSRDIIVQESTFRLLSSRGYSLVSSENPDSSFSWIHPIYWFQDRHDVHEEFVYGSLSSRSL